MNNSIVLTWDLFVIVFFLIIVSYSIMIGKDQTIKVILSSYIAVLVSDALGNIISGAIGNGVASGVLLIPSENKTVILTKIFVFVFLTVAMATRGAFDVVMPQEQSGFMRIMMTASYGILSSGLIISTVLVYLSGVSLLSLGASFGQNPLYEIAADSPMVRMIIQNYSFWFSLPAIAFIISSLFGSDD